MKSSLKLMFSRRSFGALSILVSLLFSTNIFAQVITVPETQISKIEPGQVICIKSNGYYLADSGGDTPAALSTNTDLSCWWLAYDYAGKAKPLINLKTGRILYSDSKVNEKWYGKRVLESVTWKLTTQLVKTGQTEWGNLNSYWFIGYVTEKGTYISGESVVYIRPKYENGSWSFEKATVSEFANFKTEIYTKGTIELQHYRGHANAALLNNGLQQVHENTNIIYANPGETKQLKLQISNPISGEDEDKDPHHLKAYYRWYDYTTDKAISKGTITVSDGDSYPYSTFKEKGMFRILSQYFDEKTLGVVSYTMADNQAIKIACDVSQYTDYSAVATSTGFALVEPTLSYRMVYDIRPASIIAEAIDKCTSTPFEEYNVIAPAGSTTVRIGPKYRWTGANNNYYYNKSNPTPISGQWYKGSSAISTNPIDDRLITITAPAVGDTVVYYLKSGNYIIAKFNVFSNTTSEIGPYKGTIKSHTDILKTYTQEAAQLFDFTDETGNIYTKPLSWSQTTYGFAYTSGVVGDRKTRSPGFADWSEYILLKKSAGLATDYLSQNITDFSANGKGYFLYIDANEVPGKVADLTIDGNLCPNTKILVSARVVNAQASIENKETNPNLNFIVTGIAGDVEDQLLVYTTGDIPTTDGAWNQILFHVKLGDKTYDEYRLRIDNNGTSAVGNDFAIDDIRIYVSRPKILGLQAMVGCPKDRHDKSNIAVLRVDYNKAMENDVQNLYYSWLNGNNPSQGTENRLQLPYIGTAGTTYAKYFGKIQINRNWTKADVNGRYYESLEAFFASDKYDNLNPGDAYYFFVNETMVDEDTGVSETYLVLYIVHKDVLFVGNKIYTAQMIFDADNITSFPQLETCASQYVFRVVPRANIVLDGKERDAVVLQNCAMGSYPLAVKTYGTATNGTTIKSTICYSDWLLVTDEMSEAERWGYAERLVDFREEVLTTGKDQVSVLKNGKYPKLYELYQQGKVVLKSKEVKADISERGKPRVFMAVPIPDANSGFTICPIPMEIILRAEVSAVLANPADAESYANKPAVVQGSSCIIRVPQGYTGTYPQMEVDFLNQELFSKLTSEEIVTLGQIVMCSTDDENYKNNLHSTVYFNLIPVSGTLNKMKENDRVALNRNPNTTLTLRPGKRYGFHSKLMTVDGMAITPAFNFDIYVVPNTVVWNPSLPNSAWHNDDNWTTTDGKPAFIPLSETNVIIRKSSKALPVLPINNSNLGEGANQILKYDLTPSGISTFSSCNNIYFESGAELARQHKLTYNKAYVDLAFDKKGETNWEMISMPLEDVYRGDFYVPTTGDGSFGFNESIAAVDNRKANSFRMKAYASSVKVTKIDTAGNVTHPTLSTTGWSENANQFNMKLENAKGYAVCRPSVTTSQNFVRLPKSATTYYMFYVSGSGAESPITAPWATYDGITRTYSHKLLYDKSNGASKTITLSIKGLGSTSNGSIFLVGNPFMVNLNVKKFLDGNPSLNGNFCYEYVNGTLVATNLKSPSNEVLRPTRAIFVQTKQSASSVTLNFTEDMMSFNEKAEVVVVPKAPMAYVAPNVDEQILTLTAMVGDAKACSFIEQTNYSSKDYSDTEDAELLMLDAEMTPIGLYTIASNHALMYNSTPDIRNIPIAVMVLDSTINAETFMLTFDGVDNFDETLYLYDAYYESMLPLIEGLTLELDMPAENENRYYITTSRSGDITTDVDDIKDAKVCVQPYKGYAVVYSDKDINSIRVYDVAGRKIYDVADLNASQYRIDLPTGVYVMQLMVDGDEIMQKMIIK